MSVIGVGKGLHKDKYRADIDGIRAIAVTLVVISHALPSYLPGGFIGVDVFFVISGYLITNILIRDLNRGSFSLWTFYDRRIRRILPALLTLLLATGVVGWYCLFRPEFSLLGKHIVASSLFTENLLLWSEVSYFDVSSALKPTLHLWSLAIEEQFYILWPIVLYITHRFRLPYIFVLLTLAVLSFAVNLYDLRVDLMAAYYSPLGRSWELMVGSLLAYIQQARPNLLTRYSNAQSIAGLGLIIAGLLFIRPETPFPGFWALLPTGGTFLLLASGSDGFVNKHLLARAPMVLCGLISYPLYLWHWFCLSFAHILFGNLSLPMSVGCVALSVVLAALTFVLIERPLRTRRIGPRLPLALLAGLGAMTILGALAASGYIQPRLRQFKAPTLTEWSFLIERGKRTGKNTVAVYDLGHARRQNVLFIGDSRVAQYAARIDRRIERDPALPGAVFAIGGGCIPFEGTKTDDPSRARCWALRETAYRLAEGPRFERIIIGGAWNSYFLKPGYFYEVAGKRLRLDTDAGRKAALDRLAERVRAWQIERKEVILLLDNPVSQSFASTNWRFRVTPGFNNYPANDTAQIAIDQIELNRSLTTWAKMMGVQVIDPLAAVCSGRLCKVTTASSLPLYKDHAHFNPDWVIDNAAFIDRAVEGIPVR